MNRLESEVVRAIAARTDDLVALAGRLVSFDTVLRPPGEPPGDEAALQDELAVRLDAAGFETRLWEPAPGSLPPDRMCADRVDFAGRPQLVARLRGAGGGPSLLFNGHVDVAAVAPRETWSTDPFSPVVCDGELRGRGACDMKGGVAAMVVAAEVLAGLDVPLLGDLLVNAVTDEETTGAGTLASLAAGLRADAALVPEPTGLRGWIGSRGTLLAHVTVPGRPGHAGLRQPHHSAGGAVNAINKARVVLDALSRLREEWLDRPDHRASTLGPAEIVPTGIVAGEWPVTHPASATLRCHVQYLPEQADAAGFGSEVAREVERWIATAAAADPWLTRHPPVVRWEGDVPPYRVAPVDLIVTTVLAAAQELGAPGGVARETTWVDAATLTRAGIPAVCFGPGDIRRAHAVDEGVPVAELVTCAQVLAIAAMRMCGVVAPRSLSVPVDP